MDTRLHSDAGRVTPGTGCRAHCGDHYDWRLPVARSVIAACATFAAATAFAADDDPSGRRASGVAKPAWEFAITAYPTFVRGGDDYTSAIAVADRGPLHLEARYNYEAIGARSAFVGWTLSGGEEVKWELTPILGGTWGTKSAFVPGFEASVSWGRFDFYAEAEHVRDHTTNDENYNYVWSELGFKPVEWLRVGAVGQRTRIYGGEREFQRGPFVQFVWDRVTVAGYWFNPGSQDQVVVASIGMTF